MKFSKLGKYITTKRCFKQFYKKQRFSYEIKNVLGQ